MDTLRKKSRLKEIRYHGNKMTQHKSCVKPAFLNPTSRSPPRRERERKREPFSQLKTATAVLSQMSPKRTMARRSSSSYILGLKMVRYLAREQNCRHQLPQSHRYGKEENTTLPFVPACGLGEAEAVIALLARLWRAGSHAERPSVTSPD